MIEWALDLAGYVPRNRSTERLASEVLTGSHGKRSGSFRKW